MTIGSVMGTPAFSVVMPVLNQERYLADAIGSVQAQTLEDWELLVVDDGSSDGSLGIAQAFAQADTRIRVLRHPDGERHGAAASRNFAMRQARGRWIAFLDGDDLFLPQHLATHRAAFAAWPEARCIYGPTRWIDEGSGATRDEDPGPVAGRCHAPPDLLRRIIVNHEGEVPCTNMVTMECAVALDVGGFEEAFNLFEDQTLWVKVFAQYPVAVIAQPCAIYRQHAQSTSARSERGELAGYVSPQDASRRFLVWMRQWLDGAQVADPALDRALGWWLRRFDRRWPVRLTARAVVRLGLMIRRWRRRA